jgi:hypothetical protein
MSPVEFAGLTMHAGTHRMVSNGSGLMVHHYAWRDSLWPDLARQLAPSGARVGLYRDEDGKPTTLIADCGTAPDLTTPEGMTEGQSFWILLAEV